MILSVTNLKAGTAKRTSLFKGSNLEGESFKGGAVFF